MDDQQAIRPKSPIVWRLGIFVAVLALAGFQCQVWLSKSQADLALRVADDKRNKVRIARERLLEPLRKAIFENDVPAFERAMDGFAKEPLRQDIFLLFSNIDDSRSGILQLWFSKPWPRFYNGEPLATKLLYTFAESGRYKSVNILIRSGAEPNAYHGFLCTPLLEATMRKSDQGAKTAAVLLEANADSNAAIGNHRQWVDPVTHRSIDTFRWTPLMFACRLDASHVVKDLLKHKADVSLRNGRNQTALDLAREGQHAEIVKLLEAQAH